MTEPANPDESPRFDLSPDDLRWLARLVEENGLSELRYEEGGLRVTLRTVAYEARWRPQAAPQQTFSLAPPAPFASADEDAYDDEDAPEPPAPVVEAAGIRIEAPVMGVFYRAPKPGEPSFVEVGDVVEVGEPVGMIEAMKVFSEVVAEVGGRVREITAKNGALVQPGDALIILEAVS